ncbi:unnamed protein product [Cutaneotrichosporon oleaginosum]
MGPLGETSTARKIDYLDIAVSEKLPLVGAVEFDSDVGPYDAQHTTLGSGWNTARTIGIQAESNSEHHQRAQPTKAARSTPRQSTMAAITLSSRRGVRRLRDELVGEVDRLLILFFLHCLSVN